VTVGIRAKKIGWFKLIRPELERRLKTIKTYSNHHVKEENR
jgi:hypothetical protein